MFSYNSMNSLFTHPPTFLLPQTLSQAQNKNTDKWKGLCISALILNINV